VPKAHKSEFPSWIFIPLLVPTIVDYLNSPDAPPLLVEAVDRLDRGGEILPAFRDLPEELKWNEEAFWAAFPMPTELTFTCRVPYPGRGVGEAEVRCPTTEIRAWTVYILLLCETYGRKGALNIRRCRYEKCRRVFLDDKNKGKLACSPECSTLARSQIHYDKLKANPRAYKQYKKEMREIMRERRRKARRKVK